MRMRTVGFVRSGLGRLGLCLLTSVSLSGGLASPGQAADATPQKGGTVIMGIGVDPPTINPVVSTAVGDTIVGCVIYQGLTTVLADGSVHPLLAKSWTISPDGKTYEFLLNKAAWSDGKPFTSEDVKFSLIEANAKLNAVFSASGKLIDSIDAPTPDKAVVHLKQPFGPFLMSLACGWGGAILPEHIYKGTDMASNPATTTKPVGVGPFILSDWKRGDYLRLTRNPNYWEPSKPYLDEIVAKIIPQSSTRTQAIQAGEVDYLYYYYLPNSDHAAIESNSKLTLFDARIAPVLDVMSFNVGKKPLDDKRVRHALLMATDRDYLLKNAWLGKGKVGTMPFSADITWAVNPAVDYRKMYPFDVAKANALLDEVGLKRGADGTRFKARVLYATEEAELALVAQALKGMWKAVGVDVDIDAADRASELKKAFQDRDFEVTLNGYGTYYDPALGLARLFVTPSIGALYGNAAGYSNPEIDALFQKAQAATSIADRGAIYKDIQSRMADDLPVVALREKGLFNAASKKIHGLDGDVETYYSSWRNVWLEK